MGSCDTCTRKCVLLKTKKTLSEEIDAGDETLIIGADQKFGTSTTSNHYHDLEELEKKLLLLKNITILYDGKTKKVISIN